MTLQIKPAWSTTLASLIAYPACALFFWCTFIFRSVFRRDHWRLPDAFESGKIKLVVVTGCDTGLGRVLVEHMATLRPDYRVLALTLKKDSAEQLNSSDNPALLAMQCDVTSKDHVALVQAKVRTMLDEDDSVILYGVVNNAGVNVSGEFLWFDDISSYERMMDVNYFGAVRITKALIPFMLRSSQQYRGRIINVTSVTGVVGTKFASGYASTKAALEMWSDVLRSELSHFGVQVVKVRPGRMVTPLFDIATESLLNNFESAPGYVREMYGGSAFRDSLKSAAAADGIFRRHAPGPDEVAGTLAMLLTTPTETPNAHYWVGDDARIIFRAMASLPARVLDPAQLLMDFVPPIRPLDDEGSKNEKKP